MALAALRARAPVMVAGSSVRVLTWNVHGCIGRDGICAPERVARVLEAGRLDIVALQEIDGRFRKLTLDPFSYFGELFGWETVAARTVVAKDGDYGHVVMSRWPIASLGEIDLSVRFREPRKAIVAAITTPAGRITVLAVHLGLLPWERRIQLGRIRARIDAIVDRPIITLGDFNDFPGRGLAERTLCPPLEDSPSLPTYPSRWPLLPLDRIWYSQPLELVTIETLRDASHLSDHLPLVASLRGDANGDLAAKRRVGLG